MWCRRRRHVTTEKNQRANGNNGGTSGAKGASGRAQAPDLGAAPTRAEGPKAPAPPRTNDSPPRCLKSRTRVVRAQAGATAEQRAARGQVLGRSRPRPAAARPQIPRKGEQEEQKISGVATRGKGQKSDPGGLTAMSRGRMKRKTVAAHPHPARPGLCCGLRSRAAPSSDAGLRTRHRRPAWRVQPVAVVMQT